MALWNAARFPVATAGEGRTSTIERRILPLAPPPAENSADWISATRPPGLDSPSQRANAAPWAVGAGAGASAAACVISGRSAPLRFTVRAYSAAFVSGGAVLAALLAPA